MLNTLVVLLVLFGGLAIAVWFRLGREYRRLFADRHLFGELPNVLAGQKAAAFTLLGKPVESREDPRIGMTTAGLATAYTAEKEGTDTFNHLSLSYRGGPVALAFGARCAYFLLTFLGIDPAKAALAHSRVGIIHIAFLLEPDEVGNFQERALEIPSADRIEEVKGSAEAWRDRLLAQELVLRDEGELLPRLLRDSPDQG